MSEFKAQRSLSEVVGKMTPEVRFALMEWAEFELEAHRQALEERDLGQWQTAAERLVIKDLRALVTSLGAIGEYKGPAEAGLQDGYGR